MRNSRFTVATHILSVLGLSQKLDPQKLVKSHHIAESVNTNPVIIRRILATLRDGGLVHIQGGASGGAQLSRQAKEISLLDVHRLIDDEAVFALHSNPPSRKCLVGANIKPVLQGVFQQVDGAIDTVLEKQTIGDLVSQMEAQAPASGENLT